jgi:acyl-CoA thioesterase I
VRASLTSRRIAAWVLAAAILATGWVAAGPPQESVVPVEPVAAAPAKILKIMPLGASSTVGTRSPETGGYRGFLEKMLDADGIAYDMVGSQQQGPSWMRDRDHEGHAGTTMLDIQPSLPGWISATHPDLILLHVGTNDLLKGASGTETTNRLNTTLHAIWDVEPNAYVVVAGVWAPMATKLTAKADYEARAALLVQSLAAQGEPVTFVDTATLLPKADVADGLHANAKGYELVAKVWEREIQKYLRLRRTTEKH